MQEIVARIEDVISAIRKQEEDIRALHAELSNLEIEQAKNMGKMEIISAVAKYISATSY